MTNHPYSNGRTTMSTLAGFKTVRITPLYNGHYYQPNSRPYYVSRIARLDDSFEETSSFYYTSDLDYDCDERRHLALSSDFVPTAEIKHHAKAIKTLVENVLDGKASATKKFLIDYLTIMSALECARAGKMIRSDRRELYDLLRWFRITAFALSDKGIKLL